MKTLGLPFALGLVGTTFVASLASAHVRLVAPTPRYPTPTGRDTGVDIKDGPCGRLNGTRTTDTARITTFQPGQTIAVTFNETIQHTGWFRIAFDDNGQDAFVAPLSTAMVQMGPTFTLPVLADNITDNMNGGMRTVMVTLPNVECENCTLQLIQVMDTGTMTSWAADDIYYTCADIVLRRTGGGGAGGMGGMPNGGAGGAGMPAMGGAGLGGVGGIGGSGGSGGDLGGVGPGGLGGASSGGAAGTATGGSVSTGGVTTGGTGTGGAPGGGAPATGGVPTGSGGTSAAGGPTAGTTSNGATPPPETAEDSGCHLAPGRAAGSSWPLAALALAAIGAVRRRRVSRSAAV